MSIANFIITGRVGAIHEGNGVSKITVYSNTKRGGKDISRKNTVSVFAEKSRAFITEHVAVGDAVSVEGNLAQNSYEKNGERVYVTDLTAFRFNLEAKK